MDERQLGEQQRRTIRSWQIGLGIATGVVVLLGIAAIVFALLIATH